MVSDVTGALAGDEVATAEYWVEHLRRAVRFADGMTTLHSEGCNVFLEVGPAPILSSMGRRCLPDPNAGVGAQPATQPPGRGAHRADASASCGRQAWTSTGGRTTHRSVGAAW